MKRFILMTVVFVLAAAPMFAANLSELTTDQQQIFKDGCFLAAANILAVPVTQERKALAEVFLSKPNPPYEKLWQFARVYDNSANSPCGTAAGSDLDIDSCSSQDVTDIIAGSFDLLADAQYPSLAGVAVE